MEQSENLKNIADPVEEPLLKSAVPPLRGDVGVYDKVPRRIVCQFCSQEVLTRIEHSNGLGTHLSACGLCVVGCVR